MAIIKLEDWELEQIERFASELSQCASRAIYCTDDARTESLIENAVYRLGLLNEILRESNAAYRLGLLNEILKESK